MEYATIVVLLALLQFIYFALSVGGARGKYKVSAPATEGNDIFERMFRVQQNTMEQLIVFVPSAYAFAYYVSGTWVLLGGSLFILGRFVYAAAYIKDPKSRGPGMTITFIGNLILLIGGLVGAVMKLL